MKENVDLQTISLYEYSQAPGQHYQYLGEIYTENANALPNIRNFLKSIKYPIDPIYFSNEEFIINKKYTLSFYNIPNTHNLDNTYHIYYNIYAQYARLVQTKFALSHYVLYTQALPDPDHTIMIQDPLDSENFVRVITTLDFSKYRYSAFWLKKFNFPGTHWFGEKEKVLVYEDLNTRLRYYTPIQT